MPPDLNSLPADTSSATSADWDRRFSQLHGQLRAMARSRLRHHRDFTLLGTTALVNESYLKLVKVPGLAQAEEPAFLAYAAQVMRSVIVDAARSRLAVSRGEGQKAESLDEGGDELAADTPAQAILDVQEALLVLERSEPRLAEVITLQYFVGLTDAEVAQALGISERTVRRDNERARLLLRGLLS